MANQLEDIIPYFVALSPQKQKALVGKVRYDKYVRKPALQIRKKKATKKKAKKAVNASMKKLLQGMSPEQIQQIIAQSQKES